MYEKRKCHCGTVSPNHVGLTGNERFVNFRSHVRYGNRLQVYLRCWVQWWCRKMGWRLTDHVKADGSPYTFSTFTLWLTILDKHREKREVSKRIYTWQYFWLLYEVHNLVKHLNKLKKNIQEYAYWPDKHLKHNFLNSFH